MKTKLPLLATLVCAFTINAFAADDADSQRPPQGKPPTPPQAAIDACKGLSEKDVCQFTGRNSETVAGVCSIPPSNGEATVLSCRPNRPNGQTPPERK